MLYFFRLCLSYVVSFNTYVFLCLCAELLSFFLCFCLLRLSLFLCFVLSLFLYFFLCFFLCFFRSLFLSFLFLDVAWSSFLDPGDRCPCLCLVLFRCLLPCILLIPLSTGTRRTATATSATGTPPRPCPSRCLRRGLSPEARPPCRSLVRKGGRESRFLCASSEPGLFFLFGVSAKHFRELVSSEIESCDAA